MKSLTSKNIDFIYFVNRLSAKQRAKFMSSLTSCQVKTISEIFNNFIKKNLTTDYKTIVKIKPYKTQVKQVALKSIPIYKKKKILASKKGGAILSTLLPIAISLFSSLLR